MSARGTCTATHPVLAPCADPECYRLRPLSDDLPRALIAARLAAEMSTEQVAAEITRQIGSYCGSAQVELYESGRLVPSVAGLRALADALNVPADVLLGREARDGGRYPTSR